jgi:hypothetical protein
MRCLFVSLVLLGCSPNKDKPSCMIHKLGGINSNLTGKGCLLNGKEIGFWELNNEQNEVYEKGNFKNGLRNGKWIYPLNKADSFLFWNEKALDAGKLRYSVPDFFELEEDSSYVAKFSNQSDFLANIVVSLSPQSYSDSFNSDSFFLTSNRQIKAQGWKFKLEQAIFQFKHSKIFLQDYTIYKTDIDSFKILNGYRLLPNKKLIELNVRFHPFLEETCRIIFLSMLTSMFYEDKRIVDLFEQTAPKANFYGYQE